MVSNVYVRILARKSRNHLLTQRKRVMFCIDLQQKRNCIGFFVKIVYSFILTCMFDFAFMTTGDLSSNLPSLSVKNLLCMYTMQQTNEFIHAILHCALLS